MCAKRPILCHVTHVRRKTQLIHLREILATEETRLSPETFTAAAFFNSFFNSFI